MFNRIAEETLLQFGNGDPFIGSHDVGLSAYTPPRPAPPPYPEDPVDEDLIKPRVRKNRTGHTHTTGRRPKPEAINQYVCPVDNCAKAYTTMPCVLNVMTHVVFHACRGLRYHLRNCRIMVEEHLSAYLAFLARGTTVCMRAFVVDSHSCRIAAAGCSGICSISSAPCVTQLHSQSEAMAVQRELEVCALARHVLCIVEIASLYMWCMLTSQLQRRRDGAAMASNVEPVRLLLFDKTSSHTLVSPACYQRRCVSVCSACHVVCDRVAGRRSSCWTIPLCRGRTRHCWHAPITRVRRTGPHAASCSMTTNMHRRARAALPQWQRPLCSRTSMRCCCSCTTSS